MTLIKMSELFDYFNFNVNEECFNFAECSTARAIYCAVEKIKPGSLNLEAAVDRYKTLYATEYKI